MLPQATGKPQMNWTQDPRNPRAEVAPAASQAGAGAAIEAA
jgi:dihydropyrimidine dehydrogenase (NAD+) subunit PreA